MNTNKFRIPLDILMTLLSIILMGGPKMVVIVVRQTTPRQVMVAIVATMN